VQGKRRISFIEHFELPELNHQSNTSVIENEIEL